MRGREKSQDSSYLQEFFLWVTSALLALVLLGGAGVGSWTSVDDLAEDPSAVAETSGGEAPSEPVDEADDEPDSEYAIPLGEHPLFEQASFRFDSRQKVASPTGPDLPGREKPPRA